MLNYLPISTVENHAVNENIVMKSCKRYQNIKFRVGGVRGGVWAFHTKIKFQVKHFYPPGLDI